MVVDSNTHKINPVGPNPDFLCELLANDRLNSVGRNSFYFDVRRISVCWTYWKMLI
jgi:hypothetical protein